MSTIYALSTVFGKSGVAVFRVSGPDALKVLGILKVRLQEPQPRFAYFVKLLDEGLLLDEVVIIYFAAPASFTGEDVVEIHCHGGVAVIRHISEKLSTCFSLAEPGEFTKRAVLNNKMDLTKAEGIMDLINAETTIQLRQASKHISGSLAEEYNALRNKMVRVLAYLEAYIDFPDEDLPETVADEVHHSVEELKQLIGSYLKDGRIGEKIREGFVIAIIGKPNVGKSTLFNYLAKKDLAIVTDIPGTTRDVLEVKLDCHGYPIVLLDTAGIQVTDDVIEKEGITRALKSAFDADVVIFLRDIDELDSSGEGGGQSGTYGYREFAEHLLVKQGSVGDQEGYIIHPQPNLVSDRDSACSPEELNSHQRQAGSDRVECLDSASRELAALLTQLHKLQIPIIRVATKADVLPESLFSCEANEYMLLSVHKQKGLETLFNKIFAIISSMDKEAYIITRQRHRIALENALDHLQRFSMNLPIELAAEELRLAANHVGSITGEIKLDEVLDEIFSTFCIGK